MNGSRKTEQYRTAVQGRGVAEVWHELPDGVKYGDLCFQAERYGDALESYLKALAAVPARAQRDLHARLHFRIAGCYMRRANYRLALDHLDRARQALPRHVDRIQLAKVYGLRGQIMGNLGQYDRAERYLLWAKKLLSETNEHEELAEVEMRLGHVYARRGQFEEAPRSFLNALATFRRIGHQSGEAKALNALGLQHKNACQWREAVHYLEQARVIAERGGHQLLGPHLNLGLCHLKVGKWELAEQNLKVAERIAHELGKQTDIVRVQLTQGMLAMRRRHWNEALTLFNTAGSVATQNDYRREAILAQEFLGELYLEMGDLDAAEQNLQAALPLARELAAEGDLVDEILRRLSDLRLAQGRFDEAIPLAEESLRLVERNGDRYARPSCIRALALAQLSSGNREHGERLMESALLGFEEIAEAYQKGVTHMRYGRFLAAAAVGSGSAADLEAAAVQFQRAYGVFVDLDARTAAAHAAFERASLECKFKRLEEAASYRMKARRILPPEADPVLASQLEGLGAELEAAFTERWSAGGDVLTSLREMKRLFQGATGTEGVLEELTRLAVTRSRSARGCLAHVTDGTDVRVIAAYGWSTEDAAGLLDAMAGILETNDEDNRPQWSNNAKEDPRFQHLAAEFQTESLVLLPLTLPDNRTGFLYVDKQSSGLEAGYQEGELNLLTILAHLAALSIVERWNLALAQENQQLRARIEGEDETRFVTANAELKDTLRLVSKVANSPVSILI